MNLQDLQTKLNQSRKSGDKVALSLLQVVLGDLATLRARSNKEPTEEQVENMIRSVRTKNTETLGLIAGKGRDEVESRLNDENAYLTSLLPTTLTVDEIVATLAGSDVKEARSDGQAVGAAMKLLKVKGLKALGEDVKKAVERLRNG